MKKKNSLSHLKVFYRFSDLLNIFFMNELALHPTKTVLHFPFSKSLLKPFPLDNVIT